MYNMVMMCKFQCNDEHWKAFSNVINTASHGGDHCMMWYVNPSSQLCFLPELFPDMKFNQTGSEVWSGFKYSCMHALGKCVPFYVIMVNHET